MNSEPEYQGPVVTVDSILFQLIQDELYVLLTQRAYEPFLGEWALPGGYNYRGETTHQALAGVLSHKAGIEYKALPLTMQLYTFDNVDRDPRGHTISVTYMSLAHKAVPAGSDTTQNPQFFPVTKLPHLAYDHKDIILFALQQLRSRIVHTNAVFALMPEKFTLTQLQTAYEAVLGHKLDKRNFRKRWLALDVLAPTDELAKDGAHRPAALYKFKQRKLETLDPTFA
jgi:8-oxo-dGTP diphosphatase